MLKTYFKQLISSLDLLGGAFSGLILLITALTYLSYNFSKAPVLIKLVVLFMVLVIVIFVVRQFRKIKDVLDEKVLNKEIQFKVDRDKKINKFDPSTIPTTSDIKKWVKLLSIKSRKWASDAKISSYTFYYTLKWHKSYGVNHTFGISFNSDERGENLTLYIESNMEILTESIGANKPKISIDYGEAPFYLKVHNWRKAVIFLYRRMENKVEDSFEIKVSNSMDRKIFLYFNYSYGPKKIHSSFHGEYDGKILTLYRTGEKINLK
ncbi:MAG: hypothetical protein WCV93_00395 [Candidatus Shapirobacteria bacterium]|jgi:hypothetical protein